MRKMRWVGLFLAVACLPASVGAQPGKYSATIKVDGIQMRSGASWQFPTTGNLKKGEQVIVHHEDGVWVAIVPPPGSVSWVNHRFLDQFDPNATGKQNANIMADGTEVRVGSEKGTPLGVAQVKLPRGTLVEIVGAKVRDETSTWYPITPPDGEFRWLPKEALGTPAPLAPPPVFIKSPTNPIDGTNGSKPTGTLTSGGPKPSSNIMQSQWEKAEQAERASDYATAEKLYTLIFYDLRKGNGDPETILICQNRIVKCQDRLRLDPNTRRPSLTPPPLVEGARPPASLQPPTGSGASAASVSGPNDKPISAAVSTGAGNLRRTLFTIDGKQAYALETDNGQVRYYVTAGKTTSLDPYVNRQVDLQGDVQVRGDIRGAPYMVVSSVTPK